MFSLFFCFQRVGVAAPGNDENCRQVSSFVPRKRCGGVLEVNFWDFFPSIVGRVGFHQILAEH